MPESWAVQLGPIVPIDLVSIVLGRIVAGRHHDSGRRVEKDHRMGQSREWRRRFRTGVLESLGPPIRVRRLPQFPRSVASVIAYDHAGYRLGPFVLAQIVSKARRDSLNEGTVHSTGARSTFFLESQRYQTGVSRRNDREVPQCRCVQASRLSEIEYRDRGLRSPVFSGFAQCIVIH